MLLGFLDPRRRGDRDFRCQEIVTTTTGRSGMAPSNYPSSFLLSLSLSFIYIYIFKKYYRSTFGRVVLQSAIQPIISNCSKYRTTYLLSLSFSLFLYLEFVDFIDPLSVGKYFCNTFVLPSDMFQSIGSNLLSKFIHNHSLVRSIFVEILINE